MAQVEIWNILGMFSINTWDTGFYFYFVGWNLCLLAILQKSLLAIFFMKFLWNFHDGSDMTQEKVWINLGMFQINTFVQDAFFYFGKGAGRSWRKEQFGNIWWIGLLTGYRFFSRNFHARKWHKEQLLIFGGKTVSHLARPFQALQIRSCKGLFSWNVSCYVMI